jgi:hypothetical protein
VNAQPLTPASQLKPHDSFAVPGFLQEGIFTYQDSEGGQINGESTTTHAFVSVAPTTLIIRNPKAPAA